MIASTNFSKLGLRPAIVSASSVAAISSENPSRIDALSEQMREMKLRIPDLVRSRCVDLSSIPPKVVSQILGVGEVPGLEMLLRVRAQHVRPDLVHVFT